MLVIHIEEATVMHTGRKHYISEYASGWRWAVIEDGQRVVARGLADTYAAAVARTAAAELATDEHDRPSRFLLDVERRSRSPDPA